MKKKTLEVLTMVGLGLAGASLIVKNKINKKQKEMATSLLRDLLSEMDLSYVRNVGRVLENPNSSDAVGGINAVASVYNDFVFKNAGDLHSLSSDFNKYTGIALGEFISPEQSCCGGCKSCEGECCEESEDEGEES